MQSLLQKSRLAALLTQRNSYLLLSSGLLLLCLLLTTLCFYLANRQKVVIAPPVVDRAFWVTNNEVSADYLTQMTLFYSSLRFTITPANAAYQQQTLLRYTDPAFYGSFKDELVAEADKLKDQHVSLVFYPVSTEVDAKNLRVNITGDLVSHIGNTALPPERVIYQWRYRYDNGRLLIQQLQEIKPHA